jgi:hypothetical protein
VKKKHKPFVAKLKATFSPLEQFAKKKRKKKKKRDCCSEDNGSALGREKSHFCLTCILTFSFGVLRGRELREVFSFVFSSPFCVRVR